jgi:hypothetical protein
MVYLLNVILALGTAVAGAATPSTALLESNDTAASHRAAASASPVDQQARCVIVRTEARYRAYGYDHLVHLKNGCEKAVVCTVSTNVNPKELKASLEAGASTTVITFKGSPARTFQANVSCRFQ